MILPFIPDIEAEHTAPTIDLPFPDKVLWPNGRGHFMAKHTAFKKHKAWAHTATLSVIRQVRMTVPFQIHYVVTPKTAHAIDVDNVVAAMKAYQDGIAAALQIDDSLFTLPTVAFDTPKKPGRVLAVLG